MVKSKSFNQRYSINFITTWLIVVFLLILLGTAIAYIVKSRYGFLPSPLAIFQHGHSVYPIDTSADNTVIAGVDGSGGEFISEVGITDNKKVVVFRIFNPRVSQSSERFAVCQSNGLIIELLPDKQQSELSAMRSANSTKVVWHDPFLVRPLLR